MKKVLVMILVLALCLSMFAGCGKEAPAATATPAPATPAPEETFADKYDELYLYTEVGFPPFEYYDGTEAVGVDIEIGQAVADKLGWELVVTDVPFDGLVAGLTAENAIVAAGMTITPEREEAVDFAPTYFESGLSVIAKTGSLALDAEGKVAPALLDGMTIGTQTGTTGDIYVFDNVKDGKTKGYQNVLFGMSDMGDVLDVFIIDTLPAVIAASTNDEYTAYPLAEYPADPYGIAVADGNKELLEVVTKVVNDMLASGEIEALIEKHKDAAQ